VPWGTSTPILIFGTFFVFELRARTGQTDRRTDVRATGVIGPGRQHNNVVSQVSEYNRPVREDRYSSKRADSRGVARNLFWGGVKFLGRYKILILIVFHNM